MCRHYSRKFKEGFKMEFLPTLDLLKVVHTFHPQYQSKTGGRKRRNKKLKVFQTVNNT